MDLETKITNQIKTEKEFLVEALAFRDRLNNLIEQTQGTVELKEKFKLLNMKFGIEKDIALLEKDIKTLEKEIESYEKDKKN